MPRLNTGKHRELLKRKSSSSTIYKSEGYQEILEHSQGEIVHLGIHQRDEVGMLVSTVAQGLRNRYSFGTEQ